MTAIVELERALVSTMGHLYLAYVLHSAGMHVVRT
jgi:hypothetical protein